jgi:hypothetical protein
MDFATYCNSEQLIGTLELPMQNANFTETFPLKDFYTTPAHYPSTAMRGRIEC